MFIYQRKEGNSTFGTPQENLINEVKLIRFDSSLQLIEGIDLFNSTYSKRVNTIKSVMYGKNILMAYTVIPE